MAIRPAGALADAVVAFVAAMWLGMLAGVSFLATPVKFQAASLDLPVALEIGHVTFAAFAKVEWGLSLTLGIAVLLSQASAPKTLFAVIAVLVVVVQALWLLPILDVRVEAVIAGRPVPASIHHLLYAAAEAVKAAALMLVALIALLRLGWREKQRTVAGFE